MSAKTQFEIHEIKLPGLTNKPQKRGLQLALRCWLNKYVNQ